METRKEERKEAKKQGSKEAREEAKEERKSGAIRSTVFIVSWSRCPNDCFFL